MKTWREIKAMWTDTNKIGKPTGKGCIMWKGAVGSNGYGRLTMNSQQCLAHVVALEAKLGRKLGKGKKALHSCNNKLCVNPKHLREGDMSENAKQYWNENGAKRRKKD